MKIDWRIAELCGIILGDGHVHTTENRITIYGSLDDKHYYENYIIPLFQSLFDFKPLLIFHRRKNSYSIQAENKAMFKFWINKVNLHRGNKIKASIPNIILEDINLIPHFLRGFFDTDGSLTFSKQTKLIGYYPRVRLHCQKSLLGDSISVPLTKLNFNFGKSEKFRKMTFSGYCNKTAMLCYEISGKSNLIKWMKMIGSSNPTRWTKFLIWKKYGYYIAPYSSLKERLKILKIKNLLDKKPLNIPFKIN